MNAKAQHYVPQFYLRNFSTNQNGNYKIWCFDKSTLRSFQTNPKNVAQENRFYDFENEEGESVSLENQLSIMEKEFKDAIYEICSDPSQNTLETNKLALANFIAIQISRTPMFGKELEDMEIGTNKRLERDGIQLPRSTLNEVKQMQAWKIQYLAPQISNILLGKKWIVSKNFLGKPFLTSDNPTFNYNQNESPFMSNLGLLSKGVEVYTTLSPQLAILQCDLEDNQHLPTVVETTLPVVEFVNSGQVINSQRYLFSKENDFKQALQMIKEHPHLGDPNHPRVLVE